MNSLQSLAIKGNPLAQDTIYRQAVIAFVPSLIYVDFSMIMEEEVYYYSPTVPLVFICVCHFLGTFVHIVKFYYLIPRPLLVRIDVCMPP